MRGQKAQLQFDTTDVVLMHAFGFFVAGEHVTWDRPIVMIVQIVVLEIALVG